MWRCICRVLLAISFERLRHFINERLLKLVTHYTQVAHYDGQDRFAYDIAIKCRDECQRRGLHVPRLRRHQRRLVPMAIRIARPQKPLAP
jgi:hypothetical protein